MTTPTMRSKPGIEEVIACGVIAYSIHQQRITTSTGVLIDFVQTPHLLHHIEAKMQTRENSTSIATSKKRKRKEHLNPCDVRSFGDETWTHAALGIDY